MENIKVDVIIPAYHPGKEFSTLIERLTKQTFPIHRIIVMNTAVLSRNTQDLLIIRTDQL